ncbi:hypothetical protein ISS04_02680 [Candidatus Woesearchaeota archaeon]|nr:hypothetical protein [Candidatus Woesearchaeota archaeon]
MAKSKLEQELEIMKIIDLGRDERNSKIDSEIESILDELDNNKKYSRKHYVEYPLNQEGQEKSRKALREEKERYSFGYKLIHGEYE